MKRCEECGASLDEKEVELQCAARDLLVACKGALAALSQSVAFSDGQGGTLKILQGDCATARSFLKTAIAKTETK